MNKTECFKQASSVEKLGPYIFYPVLLMSLTLLVFPKPAVEDYLHPCLIVLAFLAITCTVVVSFYQTEGNRLLRASQLSDALGAGLGDPARPGYYNNNLPQSILRLAVTTLENTLFTKAILADMATKERIKNCIFITVLVMLLACRWTSTSWLLTLAQTLFSADLILQWWKLERFRTRTKQVHDRLKQFFLQNGNACDANGLAILIAAFTDYECAKDEGAMPLDEEIFNKLNPKLSLEWEQLKIQLKIV